MDDKEIKKEGKGSKNNMQLVVLLIGVFVIAIVGTHFLNSNKTLKEAGFPYSSPGKATEITAESEITDTEINENSNIGDMFELGENSEKYHYEIGTYLADKNIDELVVVGELSKQIVQAVKDAGSHIKCNTLNDNGEATLFLMSVMAPGDIVLIKGSNGMNMSQIVSNIVGKKEEML